MILLDMLRSDGSIVVNKDLVFALGTDEAIIYSELLSKYSYFSDREEITEDGFFFNTVDNLRLDTGIGEKTQKKAINKLVEKGLIKTENRGLPRKRHFKIIQDEALIVSVLEEGKHKRKELKSKLTAKNESSKKRMNSSNSRREVLEQRLKQKEKI